MRTTMENGNNSGAFEDTAAGFFEQSGVKCWCGTYCLHVV